VRDLHARTFPGIPFGEFFEFWMALSESEREELNKMPVTAGQGESNGLADFDSAKAEDGSPANSEVTQ
jgi:hypothetical protein